MWLYMKYVVKNHSDRILLARLCTSWRPGHIRKKTFMFINKMSHFEIFFCLFTVERYVHNPSISSTLMGFSMSQQITVQCSQYLQNTFVYRCYRIWYKILVDSVSYLSIPVRNEIYLNHRGVPNDNHETSFGEGKC